MVECRKFAVGREFLIQNHWPMNLNDTCFNKCYCKCYSPKLRDTFVVGGRMYVVPRNYTRFGISVDKNYAANLNIWTDWVNCYHGTSITSAKSIIEHRMLLLPGEETMHGNRISIRPGHIPSEVFFFTTPTVKYAGRSTYATRYKFQSPSNKQNYEITVVLQCKQKRDSFVVQRQTIGAGNRCRICPFIKNEEIEWKSKQRASIIPYGLLLLVKPDNGHLDVIPKPNRSQLKVECPHCHNLKEWINPSENQGVKLTCVEKLCGTIFKPFNCPYCNQSWTVCDCFYRFNHEVVFECYNSNCRKDLMTRKCPNCADSYSVCKVPDAKQIVSVACTDKMCKSESYLVGMCPHCEKLQNTKCAAVGKDGLINTCSECSKKYQLVQCPKCSKVGLYPNAYFRKGRDDVVTCVYQNCDESFVQPLRKRQQPKNQQNC